MRRRTRGRTPIKLDELTRINMHDSVDETSSDIVLFDHLEANLEFFESVFDRSSDIIVHNFRVMDGRDAAIIYLDALSDTKVINSDILSPITKSERLIEEPIPVLSMDQLAEDYITISSTEHVRTLKEAVRKIVKENRVLLLIDREAEGLALSAAGGEDRGIQEPNTEAVIRGPREGFNESVRTNLSLIRRRLPTPSFKTESIEVGKYTKTKVAICYIDGIVEPGAVHEVRTRIHRIETDGIIDSGYIEEFIEDNSYSPFPQVQNTERPDVVTAALLEGKVSILTDGSPFALIVPINLWGAIQASEDYYERYMIANAIRFLRYAFLFINLYLPSMYVAVTTFHQELLPEKALLSIAAAREVTPFPAVIEALIMEITFEALREAGVRLPKTVGSTISIVGALVIGQAAVQAGIVSAPMVIVVSITGIGSFVIPRYNLAITLRLLRFPMILLAASLGLFGIVVGTLAIVIHLSSLRSFGVPYLAPVSPFHRSGMKDVFMRVPQWAMQKRPGEISESNPRRRTDATRPRNRMPSRRRREPQS